ncbi:hypothetical protein [Streptomyces misionensis]|uniref:hypothetical protein n=1 Tax=Streptomyces misionensis TaxID=67331 RepID=UPI003673E439
MQDLKGGVVLSKRRRRKVFVLGKSVALTDAEVAEMDDGTIRVIMYRRRDYWSYKPTAPLVVSWVYASRGGFRGAAAFVRKHEAPYITLETDCIPVRGV